MISITEREREREREKERERERVNPSQKFSMGPKMCCKSENQQLVWKEKCQRLVNNSFTETELLTYLIKILKQNWKFNQEMSYFV